MRAISTSFFDDGMETELWNALFAFLIRVSMSAIGSVMLMLDTSYGPVELLTRWWFAHSRGMRAFPLVRPRRSATYQLALRTPGTSPSLASSLRHPRHNPKW